MFDEVSISMKRQGTWFLVVFFLIAVFSRSENVYAATNNPEITHLIFTQGAGLSCQAIWDEHWNGFLSYTPESAGVLFSMIELEGLRPPRFSDDLNTVMRDYAFFYFMLRQEGSIGHSLLTLGRNYSSNSIWICQAVFPLTI